MEYLASPSDLSLTTAFSFLFFSFTFSFAIFSLLLLVLRLTRPCCNCNLCRSYLTRSWSSEHDNLCDWYSHLLEKSPSATIHLHVLNNTITANPENVEHMLKTRFGNYPKGLQFSTILGDLLGRGIFNVDGESWRFQRKMASLELGSVSIRSYAFEIVTSEIQTRLIPILASQAGEEKERPSVLDFQDVFRRFSFDTICKFSFGLDPGCLLLSLPESGFARAFDLASRLSAERAITATPLVWKVKRVLNLGTERELKRAVEEINVLAKEMIKKKREMGFLKQNQNDLLSRFMCTIDDEEYLRDIVVSFLLAGRDTVASGLTSFFWLLAQHPEVEQAIRNECSRVVGPCAQEVVASFEQLREMHYLQAAIYESMRLYPPVQFDSKFCEEDDELPDGTFVRKGTRVTYHPYAMGRMERIWGSDCLEFKPERWLQDGTVFCPVSLFQYPVFQAGPRVCLGKEMALVEMKCVALSVIWRFHIRLAMPGGAPRFLPGLTASVSGGLPVLIREKRSVPSQ